MGAWLVLAKMAVKAEFPDHDILCCFSIFNLPEKATEEPDRNPAVRNSLKLLARVIEVEYRDLREGYCLVHPLATLKKAAHSGSTNLEASAQSRRNFKAPCVESSFLFCKATLREARTGDGDGIVRPLVF